MVSAAIWASLIAIKARPTFVLGNYFTVFDDVRLFA
jgi:hypothetical protein